MVNEPKQRRGLAESLEPCLSTDELAKTNVETVDPSPKLHLGNLQTVPDTARFKDTTRQPSMVLRSRSVKSMAERYRLSGSAPGNEMQPEEISRNETSTCIPRMVMLAILLWCLVVLVVIRSIPWGDFELRWVRKSIREVQWLYPLSRQECTAGQATNRPVATCGLPKLANANFLPGPDVAPKRPRYRHSPGMLHALKMIQPSRDYTHVYEFVVSESRPTLASNTALIPHQHQQVPTQEPVLADATSNAQKSPKAPPDELVQALVEGQNPARDPTSAQTDMNKSPQALAEIISATSVQTRAVAPTPLPQALLQVVERSGDSATAKQPNDVAIPDLDRPTQADPQAPALSQVGRTPGTGSAGLRPPYLQAGSGANSTNKSEPVMDSVDSVV